MNSPLSYDKLVNIFRVNPKYPFRIINREGVNIEFKESYNFCNMSQYFRAIASFANTKGGYIIFGVGDRPRRLIGLNDKSLLQFEELKTEILTQALNDYFSPEIRWDHCTFELNNMSFGVIYVYELINKPCICKKSYDDKDDKNKKYTLREGDIYYRYVGRSERIKYTELNSIIEASRKKEYHRWFNLFKNIARIGVENANLLDLKTGNLTGAHGAVVIDADLLQKINFIQEGKFVETGGSPTLRLVGDIKEISTGKYIVTETTKKIVRAIEPKDIIQIFLTKDNVDNPIDYIKRICFISSANYPLYYFIEKASKSISEIIQIIKNTTSRYATKKKLIKRLEGKKISQQNFTETQVGIQKRSYYKQWLEESIPNKIENIGYCVQTIYCLSKEEIIEHEDYICSMMLKIYNQDYENVKPNIASDILKAICRIDECLYLDN